MASTTKFGVQLFLVPAVQIYSDREFAWPDSFVERAQLSALILCKLASGEIDAHRLKSLRLETM